MVETKRNLKVIVTKLDKSGQVLEVQESERTQIMKEMEDINGNDYE